jgi:hypothetical protein
MTRSSNSANCPLHDLQSIIQAYGQWIHDNIDDGWDAYFFTFEFNQLPGPAQERLRLMKEYLYATLHSLLFCLLSGFTFLCTFPRLLREITKGAESCAAFVLLKYSHRRTLSPTTV